MTIKVHFRLESLLPPYHLDPKHRVMENYLFFWRRFQKHHKNVIFDVLFDVLLTIYKYFYLLSLLPTLPAAALAKLTPPVGSVFFAEVGAGNPGKLDVGRETKRRGESADSVLISDTPPDDLFLFLKSILHTRMCTPLYLSVVVSSWLFSFSFGVTGWCSISSLSTSEVVTDTEPVFVRLFSFDE